MRSFRLAQLEPIALRPGIRLFSLQKGHGSEQLGEIGGRFELTDLSGGLVNFLDTAAAIVNLDLVIAPDTAVRTWPERSACPSGLRCRLPRTGDGCPDGMTVRGILR